MTTVYVRGDWSTDKEQREYEKKRADEVFSTLLRAKRIAKRRAQEVANQVEVSAIAWPGYYMPVHGCSSSV